MTLVIKSKPGLTSGSNLSIPKDWSQKWFKEFIGQQLQGADVRNAVGVNGIAVSGNLASPYATIGFAAPVTLPGPVTINIPDNHEALIINVNTTYSSGTYMGFNNNGSLVAALGVGGIVNGGTAPGGLTVYGTSSPQLLIAESGSIPTLQIASAGGTGAAIRFGGSSAAQGQNWLIGNQYNISGALEFTPSTTNGGLSTFSNPTMYMTPGQVVINGAASGTALTNKMASGCQGLVLQGVAAAQANWILFEQSGQTTWEMYQPASNNDFRLWNAVNGDTFYSTNNGNATLRTNGSPGLVINGVGGNIYGLQILAGAGSYAAISMAANGSTPGSTSFDLYMDGSSNAFIRQDAAASLFIQTNNTTRLSIDSIGQFVISNTTGGAGTPLTVNASSNAGIIINAANGSPWAMEFVRQDTATSVLMYNSSPGAAVLYVDNPLDINGTNGGSTVGFAARLTTDHASGIGLRFADSNGSPQSYDLGLGIGTATNILAFYNRTGGVNMAAFNGSNQFMVGQTVGGTAGLTHKMPLTCAGGGTEYGIGVTIASVSLSSTHYMTFSANGTQAGAIIQGASTASVSYSSGSDYRLKNNIVDYTDGLKTVMAMQPRQFNWKDSNAREEGFIAHELQAVVPHAVTGVKDAVNDDGSVRPQGVDLSKLVPYLVSAIQDLQAQIASLKAQVSKP